MLEESEHPIAPAHREDDPPELNADEGKQFDLFLPNPQPVVIVPKDVSNYVTQNFHAFSVGVSNNVVKQIASAQDSRIKLQIKNGAAAGGSSITINSDPDTVAFDGWVLAPQDTIFVTATCAVWAHYTAAVPTVTNVYLLAEFAWPNE